MIGAFDDVCFTNVIAQIDPLFGFLSKWDSKIETSAIFKLPLKKKADK